MKTKKSLYKRLNELSLIVSSNLPEIDLEYLEEVIDTISNTRVSIFSVLFEDAREYFKQNKEFPDFNYVNMHFPELLEDLNDEEPAWHYSFQNEFITLLRRDRMLQEISKAASEDDLEQVDQIITENETIFDAESKGKLPTWEELFDAYDRIKNSKPPLSFGIRELDKMYHGLCYGTLNIMAAPPGKFKTTTMNSITYVNIKEGKKVLYITLEDSWHTIYFNLTARESYEQDRLISASEMKIGQLDSDDEQIFTEVAETCAKKYKDNLRVACQERWGDFTPAGILRLIRQAKKEMGGLDMVILDHASLMKFYRVRGISDPKETINYFIRYLTNLSISFEDQFVLLIAMQTNRDGIKELESGKTGSLTNLAEANEAERSASTVTLIYSGPNSVESNIINFYPKKNRRGVMTAKPIISFIEPAAYFVGEKSIEGDVDLDDLMDDMDEKATGFSKMTESEEVKSVKVVNKPKTFPSSNSGNKQEDNSGKLIKRRVKRLNGRS